MIRVVLIIFMLFFGFQAYCSSPKLKSVSWRDNWKIDLKAGIGVMLSDVPKKYIERINNVNIPLTTPGAAGFLCIRKGISPHLELGYQFDYLQIDGKVTQNSIRYQVKTQAFGSNFLMCYNLRRTDKFRPEWNWLAYYKIGAVSLKNNPTQILNNGASSSGTGSSGSNSIIKNVAVLTGFGLGMNHQISNNFSVIATVELNRNADVVTDVYKIYKIFYHSENTVNNYIVAGIGLSYTFNFSEIKNSSYFNSRTETERRLLLSKIRKAKGSTSRSNLPIWYRSR